MSGVPAGILVIAIALLDVAIVAYLGGGVRGTVTVLAFAVLLLAPAFVLAWRLPFLGHLRADLRVTVAALVVIVAAVPLFFVRKALPIDIDALLSLVLWLAVARTGWLGTLRMDIECGTGERAVIFVVLPVVFALAWLGWKVPSGDTVRLYGLFGIDFGNLVAYVSDLRASPGLPLGFVDGTGLLSYHWLYFSFPATLAGFLGSHMGNANALIVTNLLVGGLLFHTIVVAIRIFNERTERATVAAAIVVFAPFTTYFYQAVSARFSLGPLALPLRNHLFLSPLNSMIVFGNNSVALVLALVALIELELWNRDGRWQDAIIGCTALGLIAGYSITLVFSLALAMAVWAALGRVRRPLVTAGIALVCGAVIGLVLAMLHIIAAGDGTRHLTVAFDHGAFVRMVVLGLAPVLFLAIIGKKPLTLIHVVLAAGIAVPSFLMIAGNVTGLVDFSMKTASLLAVAAAPLVAAGLARQSRFGRATAVLLITLGFVQSATYVLQFPWYRITGESARCVALPADYVAALDWIRTNSGERAVLVDPTSVGFRAEIVPLIFAERRVWLPTWFTEEGTVTDQRAPAGRWQLYEASSRGDATAARIIASQGDYLIDRNAPAGFWSPVHRDGTLTVFQSRLRNGGLPR